MKKLEKNNDAVYKLALTQRGMFKSNHAKINKVKRSNDEFTYQVVLIGIIMPLYLGVNITIALYVGLFF